MSSCQPVEETDLPAVPVVRPVHEPLHDERSWSHCRQTQSAPLRRARDDHVRDPSRRLRHSAELAMITFAIPPVVCVTPQSSRRSRSRYLLSSAPLRRARDVMFTMESTMGSTSRDLRSVIQPTWFDLPGTSCAKILFRCKVSREVFRRRPSESTVPLSYCDRSRMSSSQSSTMKARKACNLMLLRFFLVSNTSEGCATCHEQQSVEPKLAFHAEMLHSEMVFPIVRPRLVDRCALLGRHLFRFPLPEKFLRISHFHSPSISPCTARWG